MKNRWSLQIFLCLAVALGVAGTSAIPREISERYSSVPANADGIGKSYMGRQIAHVMGWQGARWLEREEREREERSDLLMRILALAPGSTVADVGAGTGYDARRIADAIGPAGKVYAIDVQPEMFSMLQSVAKQRGYGHITPLLQIRREAEEHSLVWERTANDLPWQHIVIFKRK